MVGMHAGLSAAAHLLELELQRALVLLGLGLTQPMLFELALDKAHEGPVMGATQCISPPRQSGIPEA